MRNHRISERCCLSELMPPMAHHKLKHPVSLRRQENLLCTKTHRHSQAIIKIHLHVNYAPTTWPFSHKCSSLTQNKEDFLTNKQISLTTTWLPTHNGILFHWRYHRISCCRFVFFVEAKDRRTFDSCHTL